MKLLYVIPSYEPTDTLLSITAGLLSMPDNPRVVVVDDGSGTDFRHFFDAVEKQGAVVLRHGVNLGKGRALKTALNWFLNNTPDFDGVLTLDSDGQHRMEDVVKCAEAFTQNPGALIMGSRNFTSPQTPFKSRFGNKITRSVLCYACGINLKDTQTGLRVLPKPFIPALISVKGERFEYETNMLLAAKDCDISMLEVEISTVYNDNNSGTHFNVLRDSLMIYASFARYILSSLFSAWIDILIYAVMISFLIYVSPYYIFASAVIARVISSLCNYIINRNWVFKSSSRSAIVKYYILAVCQLFVSGIGTTWLFNSIPVLGEVAAKIIVDIILFLCSYFIQRTVVFKKANSI